MFGRFPIYQGTYNTIGVQGSRPSRLKNLLSSGFEIWGFRLGLQLRAAAPQADAFQSIESFLHPFPIPQKPAEALQHRKKSFKIRFEPFDIQ